MLQNLKVSRFCSKKCSKPFFCLLEFCQLTHLQEIKNFVPANKNR